MGLGLRLKVLLPLLFLSLLFLSYLYGYYMPRSMDNIEEEHRVLVERHVDSVADAIVPLLLAHQLETIYENLDALLKENTDWTGVELVDAGGRTIYPLSVLPLPGDLGQDVHIIERQINYLDMHLGKLSVKVDFAPKLLRTKRRHWELMTVLMIIIIGYIVATGLVLDRSARRPINLVAHASKRLAEGDFSAVLPKTGDDEVGTLVNSFRGMRDAIRNYQAELKVANSYNRSLIEASLDPLVTINAGGKITDVNAATEKVTGFVRKELIGTDFSDYYTEPDEAREGYRQVFRDGAVRDYALEIRHRDGHVTPVLYNASVFRNEGGEVIGVFATARDITELKHMEKELRILNEELEERVKERTDDLEKKSRELQESQKVLVNTVEDLNQKTLELETANNKLKELDQLKSMFIASMSHELRTPLNSIIGFSSITLEEWSGPLNDEQKRNLTAVLRSGRHLLSLINDVIDISKIEAGIHEVMVEYFDLHGLIAETLSMFNKEIEEKGLHLEVEALHMNMHTDRRRLLQCMVNLASNAVKFTETGKISVRTVFVKSSDVLSPDVVEIVVSDTGIGMKEEDLAKLFSAFTRIPSPLSMKVRGTGLGLYLVKKIATEILSGAVTVQSVFGQGSSFRLRIPVTLKQGGVDEKSAHR